MIKVKIKLIGLLKTDRFRQKDFHYPSGTKVQQVIEDVLLAQQHIGIILINGEHADREAVLQDGDELVVLPLLDGG